MSGYNSDKFASYVKRIRRGSTFTANTVREKLDLYGSDLSSVLSLAVRNGTIVKVGETPSTVPYHKGRRVGVYARA